MEPEPRFNFFDVLWAPARALSAKQIFVMSVFLVIGLVIYDLFYYLALVIDHQPVNAFYHAFGFFPFILTHFHSWFAAIVFWLGIAAGVLALMSGFFAVAAINTEAVRGNRFFSARGAIMFAFRRLGQLFLSELSIGLFMGFILLLFFLLGLVSRIPFIGEWIYTLLFVIPNFIIALFSVFILFVLILTVLLLPAVAAAERQGETFGAILETFSTIIRQPVRWAGYTAYSLVAAKLCSFVFAYFAYRAVEFMVWASALGGGDNVSRLVKAGLSHLPVHSGLVREVLNIFPSVRFGIHLPPAVGSSHHAVSYVMAVMLFLIFVSILGYLGAVLAAAQARGFIAIRYIKDEYNIAEEDPLFFTDEPINPPLDTDPDTPA